MFQNEQEELFHMHKDILPDDFRSLVSKFFDLRKIFFETRPHFEKTINKPLQDLMFKQYVDFSTTDPAQKIYLKDINSFLSPIISGIYFLLEDQQDGIDFHVKYPELEKWRSFYCVPSVPQVLKDKDRNYLMFKDDQEWEEYKEKDNIKSILYHQWHEDRKQAFYDILQPVLLKIFPNLLDLEGDSWVIYAMLLRDHYEQWKCFCERLESIIMYELPLESFYWENEEYYKAKEEKGIAFRDRCIEIWDKRIYGDMV